MEETTPSDIVSSGGAVATPVKSMFQTDVIGLKMVLRASVGFAESGTRGDHDGDLMVIDHERLEAMRAYADEVRDDSTGASSKIPFSMTTSP